MAPPRLSFGRVSHPRVNRAVGAYVALSCLRHIPQLQYASGVGRHALPEELLAVVGLVAFGWGVAVWSTGKHGRRLWWGLATVVVVESLVLVVRFMWTTIFTGPFVLLLGISMLSRGVMLWATWRVLRLPFPASAAREGILAADVPDLESGPGPRALSYARPAMAAEPDVAPFLRKFAIAWSLATILAAAGSTIYIMVLGSSPGVVVTWRALFSARSLANLCQHAVGPVCVLLLALWFGREGTRYLAAALAACAAISVGPFAFAQIAAGSVLGVGFATVYFVAAMDAAAFAWIARGGIRTAA